MDDNVKIIISHIMDRINELPEERRRQALVDLIEAIRTAIGE